MVLNFDFDFHTSFQSWRLNFSIGDLSVLSLGHTASSKPHPELLLFTEGPVLPTILLKYLSIYLSVYILITIAIFQYHFGKDFLPVQTLGQYQFHSFFIHV
jgi:hypothetical protein